MLVLKARLSSEGTAPCVPLVIKGLGLPQNRFNWNGLEFVPRSRFSAESVQVFPKTTSQDEIRLWVVKGFWR